MPNVDTRQGARLTGQPGMGEEDVPVVTRSTRLTAQRGTHRELANGTHRELPNGTHRELPNGTHRELLNGTHRELLITMGLTERCSLLNQTLTRLPAQNIGEVPSMWQAS